MAIIKLVFTFFLSFTQLITPFVGLIFNGTDANFDSWTPDSVFTRDYAVELEKDPNKDFVILNLGDIQHNDSDAFSKDGDFSERLIRNCVEEIKPDLITLTGDNASGEITYLNLIKIIDSLGIPWAPIMGNHDGSNGNTFTEAWDATVLSDAENCLFKFGPKNMGYGNYIINITENGKIIHTLFMMDSHSAAEDTENGVINYGKDENGAVTKGYDHFWKDQLTWYEWAVNGIADVEGHVVESTVFMHIPVYEYRTACALMCDEVEGVPEVKYIIKEEYSDTSFGFLGEGICSPEGNNGFFALCKKLGSTKNMLAGHDHTNNSSLLYDGIRLSYTLKSGKGSYWYEDRLGVSLYNIKSDGTSTFSHHYYSEETK